MIDGAKETVAEKLTTLQKNFERQLPERSGYKYEELIGKNHNILNSGYHFRDFFQNLWTTINKGKIWHGEIRNQREDGRYYWVVSTVIPYVGFDGIPYQHISLRTDIARLVNTRSALTHAEEDLGKANAVEQKV